MEIIEVHSDDPLLTDLDGLAEDALNDLAFGTIRVDATGRILFYSRTEGELSGRDPNRVLGRNFFLDVAPCTNIPAFFGRFQEGVRNGRLDTVFEFVFDFEMEPLVVRIRMSEAAQPGEYWILVQPIQHLGPSRTDTEGPITPGNRVPIRGRSTDLTQCDREPITALGTIQPHGVLLAFDVKTLALISASANWRIFFPDWPDSPLGGKVEKLLPDQIVDALRLLSAEKGDVSISARFVGTMKIASGQSLVVMAHTRSDTLVVELEPNPNPVDGTEAVDWVSGILRSIESEDEVLGMMQRIVRAVRRRTGYERVIVYRFDANADGSVIAEDKVTDWNDPFIGLRFPASDIPAQARALYLTNRMRFMPTWDYTPVPLTPAIDPRNGAAIDLTMARLRSLSPIHREYQKNLGIDGSMSVSIIVNRKLWGLLIGHHRKPHAVPIWIQTSVNALIKALGSRIRDTEEIEALKGRRNAELVFHRLLEQFATGQGAASAALFGETTALDLIEAGGVAVLDEAGAVRTAGNTPERDDIIALASWIKDQTDETTWSTECLSGLHPQAESYRAAASGVLAFFNGQDRYTGVLWFRPEDRKAVTWAGDPHAAKPTISEQIQPRASFERWVEMRQGYSKPWADWEVDLAMSFRRAINEAMASRYQNMRRLNSELLASNSAKSRFLASVSHELRTPLNAVIGFADALKSGICGPLPSKMAEYIEHIHTSGVRQLELIKDILEISRAESDKQNLRIEPVDVVAEVRKIVTMLESKAGGRGIRIELLAPEFDVVAQLDRVSLGRCVDNLLSNALKFSPTEETVRVSINLDGDRLKITVSDNGRGIPRSELANVKQPFVQLNDASREAVVEGLGLGLALVDSLVRDHNGRMIIESDEGYGTKVTLIFPNAERATVA